jgi:serine/threonine protein kinase
MEYVDGLNLEAYLLEHGGKLPEDAARFLFQQLMVAVSPSLIHFDVTT